MVMTNKKGKSITVRFTQMFICCVALSLVTFFAIYSFFSSALMSFFHNSSYIRISEKKYIEMLQSYVSKNNISATDDTALREWSEKKKLTSFLVSRERVLIFDNYYSGDVPLGEARSEQVHRTWMYSYPVFFEDGVADVYINKNFERTYYFIAGVAAAFISVVVGMIFFVYTVKKRVGYILLLRREITEPADSDQKRFTEMGNDELTELAKALNRMVIALK